jgi:hypothetical protein
MKHFVSRTLLTAALACLPGIATAANHDESVDGDISGVPATPTAIAFSEGANVIKGAAGAGDFDLISFTVPDGHQLSSLYLDAYSNLGYQSFVGLQNSATWTTGTGFGVVGETLMGYALFDAGLVGTNLLADMGVNGVGFGSGFTPPLPSGAYSFLIQDTTSPFSYQFTFNVTAVPEPATVGLAAVGLLAITRIRRR